MTIQTTPETVSSGLNTLRRLDIETVASWLLGFGLVLFLAVNGSGFDVGLFGQAGLFIWLILLVGILLGIFPTSRPAPMAWVGVGLLAALAAWAAIGLLWTDSPDKTLVETARLSTYAAIFALAIAARGGDRVSQQVGSVAAAIVVIAALGLVSRFFPGTFTAAEATGRILTDESARLTFPLEYWNGLAALLAIGVPLLAQLAGEAQKIWLRIAATGCLPLVSLALYLTLSRGGLLAAAVALVVFHLLNRKILTLALTLIGLGGGGLLIVLARANPDFQNGLLNHAAHSQGRWMLLFTAFVCSATCLAGWGLLQAREARLLFQRIQINGRVNRTVAASLLVAVVLAGLLAAGGFRWIGDSWSNFKSSETPSAGSSRLSTTTGNGRYQLWSSGLRQFRSEPVLGQGAGTFEFWWAEHGDRAGFVKDTHSLYIQTLGESGAIGFLLLIGFLGVLIVTGVRWALSHSGSNSSWAAAGIAACLAFMVSAAFDWVWQIPVIVLPFLLLAATILSGAAAGSRVSSRGNCADSGPVHPVVAALQHRINRRESRRLGPRAVLSGFAVAGVVALASPVLSSILVGHSQEQVREGNLSGALGSASIAHGISPLAAAPLIQEAGVYALDGNHDSARRAATKATELEPVNWRNWLVLERIEAEAGRQAAARRARERAQLLNPRSRIFEQDGS